MKDQPVEFYAYLITKAYEYYKRFPHTYTAAKLEAFLNVIRNKATDA